MAPQGPDGSTDLKSRRNDLVSRSHMANRSRLQQLFNQCFTDVFPLFTTALPLSEPRAHFLSLNSHASLGIRPGSLFSRFLDLCQVSRSTL